MRQRADLVYRPLSPAYYAGSLYQCPLFRDFLISALAYSVSSRRKSFAVLRIAHCVPAIANPAAATPFFLNFANKFAYIKKK